MSNNIGNISQGTFRHLPSVCIVHNSVQMVEPRTFDDVSEFHYV